MSVKWDLEYFILKAKEIYGDLYDYSLSEYINYNENIKIICKKHGIFKKRVKHYLKGYGCSKCTQEQIKERSSMWTPEMDEYLKENYKKENAKLLSKKFNLCKNSIYNRIIKLNLKRDAKIILHHTIPLFFWTSVKAGARNRNLVFDITVNEVWELFLKQNKKCALTGWDIEFNKNRYKNIASIDRIDSSIGYIKSNIQIVHKKINKFKMGYSVNELTEMCRGVANNIKYKSRIISHWEIDILNDTEYPVYFK